MAIQRMDHVSVTVDDLDAAIAFFDALGMEVEGRTPVHGDWVDRVNALDDVRVEIAMMRTPDGHGKVELTTFHHPDVVATQPERALANTLGLRTVMFAVDDLDDTITRVREHGGELVGEVAQFEELYRICYVRGPAGMIVALAEEVG